MMTTKNFFISCAVLFGASMLAPFVVSAQVPDQILDLTVNATIDEKGVTKIVETVLYDFGGQQHHGIYRNIPIQAQEGSILRKFGITDITVTDHDGKPIPFETSNEHTYLRLKIGDEKVYVTGTIEYHISYTAATIMRGFSKFDEWLWDITSSNWPVPILRARANITFPRHIPIQDLIRSCVTLPPGEKEGKETCQVGFLDRTATGSTASIQMMDLNMVPKESMQIGLGFPKGFIAGVPEAKKPVDVRNPPIAQVLPAAFMLLLLGFGIRELVRRKWPHLIKE